MASEAMTVRLTVPLRQALALRDALTASGNQCELVIVSGGDHNFSSQLPEWKEKSRERIRVFLQQHGLAPADSGRLRPKP